MFEDVAFMVATTPRPAGDLRGDVRAGSSCEEWVTWLAPSDYTLFVEELVRAGGEKATQATLAELLDAWRATAELEHAPDVRAHIELNQGRRYMTVDEWRATQARTA